MADIEIEITPCGLWSELCLWQRSTKSIQYDLFWVKLIEVTQ